MRAPDGPQGADRQICYGAAALLGIAALLARTSTPLRCDTDNFVGLLMLVPLAGLMIVTACWNLICHLRGRRAAMWQPETEDNGYTPSMRTAAALWGVGGALLLILTVFAPC